MGLPDHSKISSVCSFKYGQGGEGGNFKWRQSISSKLSIDIDIKIYRSISFCKARRTLAHSKCLPNFIQYLFASRKLNCYDPWKQSILLSRQDISYMILKVIRAQMNKDFLFSHHYRFSTINQEHKNLG